MKNIGKRLRDLREEKKLSQIELANALGKSQVAISKYENSNRELDYDMLNKYAQYFHVSTDYLLGRVDSPNEYSISGNAYPDVMKPFLKRNTSTILVVDEPDINATDEEKKRLIEDQLKKENVLEHDNDYSLLLSLLPEEKRINPMSLYDLFYIIGNDETLMNKLKMLDPDNSVDELKTSNVEQKNKPTVPSNDELNNMFDHLNHENKEKILELARLYLAGQDKN